MKLPVRRPVRDARCYDCGSVIQNEHSELCDMAGTNPVRLPASCSVPRTQWLTVAAKEAQEARLAAADLLRAPVG